MAAWDWNVGLDCDECECSLWEDADRAFSYAPGAYLCHDCASERGGAYDQALEAWTTAPDVCDLETDASPTQRSPGVDDGSSTRGRAAFA